VRHHWTPAPRRWRRVITRFLSVLALLTLVSLTSLADARLAKLSPWVVEKTEDGREAEFLVVLSTRAELRGAEALATKLEKGRFVHAALVAHAERSQRGVLERLEKRGVPHRSLAIVNAIWVKGDRALALELAARPDVARIDGNPSVRGIEPPELAGQGAAALAPLSPDAPQTIELGVTYVRAPELWLIGVAGQGVVIGAADTGIQWDHPALKSQYAGWNGVTANHDYAWHDAIHSGGGVCGPDSPVPCDDGSHGTHTIGTAVGNDGGANQIGVAPAAKWIGCRNMDGGNGTPTTYMECMEFFIAPYPVGGTTSEGDPSKSPDISTNSWACPASEGCAQDTLKAAVEAVRAAGILFVESAGNSGSACSTVSQAPAHYDAAYSVGAFDATTGTIASFSSRGPVTVDGSNRMKPDITAPGVTVRSATPGSSYGNKSGTSMASPHVSGAAAILISALPELRGHPGALESLLSRSAVGVSVTNVCSSSGVPNNVYGFGRLDVKAAFDLGVPCAAVANGDANGDGSLTVTDVFFLINHLFAGGAAPACFSDVNGDGSVGIADVFYLINHLFAAGPPPL
jgi:serine protease AprX